MAQVNLERHGILEPPVGEFVASLGYRLFGESYWLPRSMSVVFWLIGAVLLYRIASMLLDRRAGVVSVAIYLFAPFAVIASRSFQPDPLMVTMILASVLTILRHDEHPSRRRLVVAATLSAAAVFVKPVAIFLIIGVVVALAVRRRGPRAAVDPSLWTLVLAMLVPLIGFYAVYGIALSGDVRTQNYLIPSFVLDPTFWRGWLEQIRAVLGFPLFVASLLGAFLFPRGRARAAVFGLWSGYVALCLVFSYGSSVHDYYHLPLIPIAALSVSPVLTAVLDRLATARVGAIDRYALAAIVVLGLALSIVTVRPRLGEPTAAQTVRTAEEVGALVGHGTRNVVLASDYGVALQYHGEIASEPWPLASDLEWERIAGVPALGAPERFRDWFASEHPQYFIVVDRAQLAQQDDLESFLAGSFPVLARTDDFVIYDLRAGF